MSDRSSTDREHSITTDRDRIREWAEDRGAVPAYRADAEPGERYRFFPRGEVEEGYEEHDWEEFHRSFEEDNRAFVYRETEGESSGLGEYEVIDRDEAATRATLANEEVEERLVEGETVTTEVTETTVIEREIVETDTIESEVVDRETIRNRITDAELTDWQVVDTDVDVDLRADEDIRNRDLGASLGGRDQVDYASVDLRTAVDGDATAEVEETWRIRREVDERLIVESRVVDVDVEEHDHVEEDSVETRIDTEGVQRSIIESDLLSTGTGTGEIDREIIETETVETTDSDETRLESRLVERRTYEDEVTRRERLRFDFLDAQTLETEVRESNLVDSDIVEVDYDEGEETRTVTESGTETDTTTAGDRTDAARDWMITDDDQGKIVVGEDGERVGVVTDVENDILYVEPNAGFLERLEAALGLESHDEDTYPVTADQIQSIDDDKVVLSYVATDTEGGR